MLTNHANELPGISQMRIQTEKQREKSAKATRALIFLHKKNNNIIRANTVMQVCNEEHEESSKQFGN